MTVLPFDLTVAKPEFAGIEIVTKAKFKFTGEPDYQSFPDFVSRHFDVDPSTLSGDVCFRVLFDCEDPLDVLIDRRHVPLCGLTLPVQLDIFIYEGRRLSANVYSERNEMIGRDVTHIFDLPTGSFTQRVLFLNKCDGTQQMKSFPPENVPEGYTVNFLEVFVEEEFRSE